MPALSQPSAAGNIYTITSLQLQAIYTQSPHKLHQSMHCISSLESVFNYKKSSNCLSQLVLRNNRLSKSHCV